MTPLYWLYLQHNGTMIAGNERCYLCGTSCSPLHDVQHSIADTFNSHYLAKCPSSRFVCNACHWYFDGRAGHADFRKMSLIVSSHTWRSWSRDTMKWDIRAWLEDGLPDESYLVVSLSKKKHILLQAPLCAKGSKALSIQVEEQVAHVTLDTWTAIEVPFMRLLALGHGKGEIRSGELHVMTLRKHGQLFSAMELSNQLNPWRNSPQMLLYSYATPMEEIGDRHESSHGDDRVCLASPANHLDTDQRAIQNGATTDHLESDGKQHGQHRADEQHVTGVHQQTLW